MGLMVHSLCELPADEDAYRRSFYVYLLDYGWEKELTEEMYDYFPRMAEAASRHGAVVLRGTVGHHFADEVLSWHHVNGSDARRLLPAILITTKHPLEFRQRSWITGEQGDRLLFIPLRDVCKSPRDVAPFLGRLFSDIQQKRRLSEFEVVDHMVAGRNNAILDAIVLNPTPTGTGLDLIEMANFLTHTPLPNPTKKHPVREKQDVRADILLVTVTKVEAIAVLEAFGVAGQQVSPQSIGDRVYFDLGMVQGARVMMTRCEMGSGGLGASLLAVNKGIEALSPSAVIMVGIAFGVSEEKQSIGDVLVAEQLRPYELQRVGTRKNGKSNIILRDDKPHASPRLLNLLKSSEVTWQGTTLKFGTVLTGAKLVDNVDFRDQLHKFEPEAIGGEMEGAGLYVACHDQKVDWILVKAICDFADGRKSENKEERQARAAKNAAAFVRHALGFAIVDWRVSAKDSREPGGGVEGMATSSPATTSNSNRNFKLAYRVYDHFQGDPQLHAVEIYVTSGEIWHWRIGVPTDGPQLVGWGVGAQGGNGVRSVHFGSVEGTVSITNIPNRFVGEEGPVTPSMSAYVVFRNALPIRVAFGWATEANGMPEGWWPIELS